MAKVRREEVIAAGLELLDEVGLDALTTRRLAERLGVESATLYWHVRDKAALLAEMADAILARHLVIEAPPELGRWRPWLADNTRRFRRTLLAYRDGARLHVGTIPHPGGPARLAPVVAYLVRVGFDEQEAGLALRTLSQFTVGCVLEEQARGRACSAESAPVADPPTATVTAAAREAAFEFGLDLLLDGLQQRLDAEPVSR